MLRMCRFTSGIKLIRKTKISLFKCESSENRELCIGFSCSPPYRALKTTWRNVGWAVPTMIAVRFVKKNLCDPNSLYETTFDECGRMESLRSVSLINKDAVLFEDFAPLRSHMKLHSK